tara:strand:- start:334 stop:1050 length:717 start_codon:yes stop_codon:yes gene_type:complete
VKKDFIRKWFYLGVLFLLPVIFLLFLYPSTHNYNPLDIVKTNVNDVEDFTFINDRKSLFRDNITVLSFLGNEPMNNITSVLNLKELVYDKFRGFKKFQILTISTSGTELVLEEVKKEIQKSDELKYWYFATGTPEQIQKLYSSLIKEVELDTSLTTNQVFIIDKLYNQRGRIDDRTETQVEKGKKLYGLYSYNSIKISEIKNKMSDDMRILFTEYRQKRKGKFDSNNRRIQNLETIEN